MTMRVLFVDHDPGRSGSTVSLEALIRGFARGGHAVWVLTPKEESRYGSIRAAGGVPLAARAFGMRFLGLELHFTNRVDPLTRAGVVLLVRNAVKLLLGVGMVLRALVRTRADLVYLNEYVVPQASIAAALLRVPSVVHVRSLMLKGRWGVRRRILRWLIVHGNAAVVPIGHLEAEQLSPGKLAHRIHIVGEFVAGGGGVVVTPLAPEGGFLRPPSRCVFLMLGGFLEVKGGLLFLRAAEQVLARDPRAFFVLAGPVLGGGGEQARAYARDCFECVKQLEGRGAARFLGEVEEVGTLLRTSDVLVSPSVDSHFSRPIVEAWAASKPVIAFATAHMERLIRPNVNGLLVPVGDIGLLTEAMLLLAGDAPLRSRLGAAGRLTAEEEYDEVRNTDRVVKLCAGLAGTRRR